MHHDNYTSALDYLESVSKKTRTATGPTVGNAIILANILLVLAGVAALISNMMNLTIWWALLHLFIMLVLFCGVFGIGIDTLLHWWSPFFGNDVHVNLKKITEREQAGESPDLIQSEIAEWVKSCAKGSWVAINPYRYRFLSKGDAAFFKLAWG